MSEPKEREWWRIKELAEFWRVNEKTIRRDIRKGALAARRLPSGTVRISHDAAMSYGRPIE